MKATAINISGHLVKTASIHEEAYQAVAFDVEALGMIKADIFTFTQSLTGPGYPYFHEPDNMAVITITTFDDWFSKRCQKLRNDVRRAKKDGVDTRVAELTDDLIRQIMVIHDELPERQGRTFSHYREDFSTAKRHLSTYQERSQFIGAFLGEQLIGYIKLVTVGSIGRIQQIVSLKEHSLKRPTNALIAKAVEICAEQGLTHLVYGKYIYAGIPSSLTDFKKRNGFEHVTVSKYFVPLTFRGKVAVTLRLHRSIKELIPTPVIKQVQRCKRFVRGGIMQHSTGGATS